MQYSFIPLLFAASVIGLPNPQSLSELPVCAQQAALAAIDATNCGLTNVQCLCTSVPFLDTLRSYIENHCGASDQAAALAFSEETCGSYGVTFSAPVPTAPATMMTPAPVTSLAGTATSTLMDVAPVTTTAAPSTEEYYPTVTPVANNTMVGNFTGAAPRGHEYEIAMVIAGLAGIVAFVV